MEGLETILQEYVATANNPEYDGDWEIINSKFPELSEYDSHALQEYVATANNPDYNEDWGIINSKFPEFFFTQEDEIPEQETSESDSNLEDTTTSGDTSVQEMDEQADSDSLDTAVEQEQEQEQQLQQDPEEDKSLHEEFDPEEQELKDKFSRAVRTLQEDYSLNLRHSGIEGYDEDMKDYIGLQGETEQIQGTSTVPVKGLVGAYLIGKEEEEVVPILQDMYGGWGFTFDVSGAGDNVTVTHPDYKGEEPFEVSLDNWTDSGDKAEAKKLAEFLTTHGKKKEKVDAERLYQEARKDKEEFKRLYDQGIVDDEITDINQTMGYIVKENKYLGAQYAAHKQKIAEFQVRWDAAVQVGNITDELKAEYNEIVAEEVALKDRLEEFENERLDFERRGNKLNQIMGAHAEHLADQGNLLGFSWNMFMNGVGQIASGAIDVGIDIGVEGWANSKAFVDAASIGLTGDALIGTKEYEGKEYKDKLKKDLKKIEVQGEDDLDRLAEVRGFYTKYLGHDKTTAQYSQKQMETFFGGAWGGLLQSVPAMIGAGVLSSATGGASVEAGAGIVARIWAGVGSAIPGATIFGLQSVDFVNQEMSKLPYFDDISENEKWLVKGPIAIAVGILENIGFRNVLKGKSGVVGGIVQRVLNRAPRGATYETLETLTQQQIKRDIRSGLLKRTGGGILAAGAAEAETGGSQHLAEVGVKNIYNLAKEKEIFHDAEFFSTKTLMQSIRAAGQEMIGGHIMHGVFAIPKGVKDYSYGKMATNEQYALLEAISMDPIARSLMISDLKNKIIGGTIKYGDAKQRLALFNKGLATAVEIIQTAPGLSMEGKKKAFDLINEKKTLQNIIARADDKSLVKKEMDRITEINKDLETLSLTQTDSIDLQIAKLKEQRAKFFEVDNLLGVGIARTKEDTQKIAEIDAKISSLNSQKDAVQKQKTGDLATDQQAGDLQTMEEGVRKPKGKETRPKSKKSKEAGILSPNTEAIMDNVNSNETISEQDVIDAQNDLITQLDLIDNDATLNEGQKESLRDSMNEFFDKIESYENTTSVISGKATQGRPTRVVKPGERTPTEKQTGKTPKEQIVGQELTTETGKATIVEEDGKLVLKEGDTSTDLEIQNINELELVETQKDENGNVIGATFKTPDKKNKFGVVEYGKEFTLNNPEVALDLALEETRAEVGEMTEALDEAIEEHKTATEQQVEDVTKEVDEHIQKKAAELKEEVGLTPKKTPPKKPKATKPPPKKTKPKPQPSKKKAPKPIQKAIDLAKRALKKISRTADIIETDSREEMIAYYEMEMGIKLTPEQRKLAMESNAMVSFDKNGKVEFIFVTQDATAQDLAHEMWHVILNEAFGINPKRFAKFQSSIDNLLRQNGMKEVADKLTNFTKTYTGEIKAEEYLAELGNLLVTGGIDINNLTASNKTILQQLAALINKFTQNMLGEKIFLEDATPENILSFMTEVSQAYAQGQDISAMISKQKAEQVKIDAKNKVQKQRQRKRQHEGRQRERKTEGKQSVAAKLIETKNKLAAKVDELSDKLNNFPTRKDGSVSEKVRFSPQFKKAKKEFNKAKKEFADFMKAMRSTKEGKEILAKERQEIKKEREKNYLDNQKKTPTTPKKVVKPVVKPTTPKEGVTKEEQETLNKIDKKRDDWQKKKKESDSRNKAARKNSPIAKAFKKAATDLFNKVITIKDYLNMIKEKFPHKPKTKAQIPTPTSSIVVGLSIPKKDADKGIIGLTKKIKTGMEVLTRLAIDPLDKYGTLVVPVANAKGGKIEGYGSTAVLNNVSWSVTEKAQEKRQSALDIAKGAGKTPMGWLKGSWQNVTPEQAHKMAQEKINQKGWTQIGMNPSRHSYPYQISETGLELPMVHADQIIQIGNFVIAKNAEFGDPTSSLYSVRSSKQKKGEKGDIRFRATPKDENFEGKDGEKNFDRWKGENTLVEGNEIADVKTGEPIVAQVYHGTTKDFTVFDADTHGTPEAHLGQTNYFTSSQDDANANYSSQEGPDLKNKIERRTEELEENLYEEGIEAEEGTTDFTKEVEQLYGVELDGNTIEEVSKEMARQELLGEESKVDEFYVKLNNPVVIGSPINRNNYAELRDVQEMENITEEVVEEIMDEENVTREEAEENFSEDITDRINERFDPSERVVDALDKAIYEHAYDPGMGPSSRQLLEGVELYDEVNLTELESTLRESLSQNGDVFSGEMGEYTTGGIINSFFKNLGFDGIILADVHKRFGPAMINGFPRQGMEGLYEGDSHVHVFPENKNQIKLSDGQNVEFGETADVRFRATPEQTAKVRESLEDQREDLGNERNALIDELNDKYDAPLWKRLFSGKKNPISEMEKKIDALEDQINKVNARLAGVNMGITNPTERQQVILEEYRDNYDAVWDQWNEEKITDEQRDEQLRSLYAEYSDVLLEGEILEEESQRLTEENASLQPPTTTPPPTDQPGEGQQTEGDRASILENIFNMVNTDYTTGQGLIKETKITKEFKEQIRAKKDWLIENAAYVANDMSIQELLDMETELDLIIEEATEHRKQLNAQRDAENRKLSAEATQQIDNATSTSISFTRDLQTDEDILNFLDEAQKMPNGTVFFVEGKPFKKIDFIKNFDNLVTGPTEIKVAQEVDVNTVIQAGEKKSAKWSGFLPYTAMNFKTLLFNLYGKGKAGAEFWGRTLLKPLETAYRGWGNDKMAFADAWGNLKKKYKVRKKLSKLSGIKSKGIEGITPTGLDITNNQIVYLYNVIKQPQLWGKLNKGGIDKKVIDEIVEYMENNRDLKDYANELPSIFAMHRNKVETKLDEQGLDTFGKPVYRRNLEDNINFYMSEKGGSMTREDAETKAREKLDVLNKIYDGNIPRDIPYFPIRVAGATDGKLTVNDNVDEIFDADGVQRQLTVITGNLITRKGGGALRWADTNTDNLAQQYMDGVLRAANFIEWFKRSNQMFSKENMKRIELTQGQYFAQELRQAVARIITNKRRPMAGGKGVGQAIDNWVNSSQALIMFLNVKSALLQNLSSMNFMLKDPFAYMAAMKNPWTTLKTMKEIWNSDYLRNRKGTGAGDQLMDELIEMKNRQGSRGGVKGFVANFMYKAFKFGYTPTRTMDAFAIMFGGTPFYIAQKKKYLAQGMSEQQAKDKAMLDLQEEAEDVQQSSRMDQISSQQASSAGRFVLAFANTPMQYNRKIYQAFSNLKNNRGDVKKNLGTLTYYMIAQNVLFSALQQAAQMALGDSDEEDQKRKVTNTINAMVGNLMRGAGMAGVGAAVLKDVLLKGYEVMQDPRPEAWEVAFQSLNAAPGISYKVGQIIKAMNYLIWAEKNEPESVLQNPYFRATTVLAGASVNFPAEEAIQFLEQYQDAFLNPNLDMLQKTNRALGYSRYAVDYKPWEEEAKRKEEEKASKKPQGDYEDADFEDADYEDADYEEADYQD